MSALMPFAYMGCLLFSMFGMLMLDRRHRLFWFADWRRAAIVHAAGVVTFLVWDAFGIGLGVFFRGETPFMTGVLLAPELPVEELLFLTFLCWLTMNAYTGACRILEWRARRKVTDAVESGPGGPGSVEANGPVAEDGGRA